MTLNYENTIKLLQSQGKFYIKLGLERVQAVLNLIDNPQNKIKIIHIAGTNGKGSVSSVLANILKEAGYKTGLYTSPHLFEYTERIKINNIDIAKQDFAKYIEDICILSDNNNIHLTEFEILTVCAYKYFYEKNVDIAVIETGLGGRFDATNVVENKLISIITSISLDHTDRLGETIEKIAFEKAGIINKHSEVIISKNNKGLEVVKEISNKKNTNIYLTEDLEINFENGKNYILNRNKKYEFPLLGLYQKQNMSLVIKAVELLNTKNFNIDENSLINGLKTAKWKARLEFIKDKNILIDGAHNPDSAKELKKSLNYYFKNQQKTFIYSTINTKNYLEIAKNLFNEDDIIYYYEFKYNSAVSYEEYKKNVDWLKNLKKLNIEELSYILNEKSLKIITGSLYMIGDIYEKIL